MIKISRLKILEWKLHSICTSDDNIAIEILALKFLVDMEMILKHYWGHFYWDTLLVSGRWYIIWTCRDWTCRDMFGCLSSFCWV